MTNSKHHRLAMLLRAFTIVWCFAGDLPNPGIEPRSLALQADSLPAGPPGKHPKIKKCRFKNPDTQLLFKKDSIGYALHRESA